MVRQFLWLSLFTLIAMSVQAQTLIPLYPGNIPGAIPTSVKETLMVSNGVSRMGRVSTPTLELFLPPAGKANGAAVVVIPGGGYSIVAYTHEGTAVAAAFNKIGVAAFVLKYRIPSDAWMKDKTIGPLQDAQTALKLVRERAAEWKIDTARVGVIGFSAGGHLASTTLTHFQRTLVDNPENTNLRPAFGILIYPVINLGDSLMHKGSRTSLLGADASPELVRLYSTDLQVTKNTPPTLLVHAADDRTVKVGNSLSFFQELIKHGVPAELHVYPKGGHGFGLNNPTTADNWMDRVENWMRAGGWIN